VLAQRSGATLLGVTWQWVGRPGAPFAYRGSVGPWPLKRPERARIAHLGRVLASAFGLVGLFGIDLILRAGQPWPVEINPRYTASVEVLELALGRALLADHGQVFGGAATPKQPRIPDTARRGVVGKAILFAEHRCTVDIPARYSFQRRHWFAIPRLADVPHPGERFRPGEPVLTVFARAASIEDCRVRLERRLAAWQAHLRRT
jgi:uncharacterized protein